MRLIGIQAPISASQNNNNRLRIGIS